MIKQYFQSFLDQYLEYLKTRHQNNTEKNRKVTRELNETFKNIHDDLLQSKALKKRPHITDVELDVGKQSQAGKWRNLPRFKFLHSRKTLATTRIYCEYIFRTDMHPGFYILIHQDESEEDSNELQSRAKSIHQYYCNDLIPKGFSLNKGIEIDLKRTSNKDPHKYNECVIASKFYAAGEIPSDTELIEDLEAILMVNDNYMAGSHPTPSPEPTPEQNSNHLYDYFVKNGFTFSKEVLTRYYLSLKTKPFVILSGISGTGKTKIAQLFAEYMCQNEDKDEARKRMAFVSVRPDWMDNKGLLGSYNFLNEKYHSTKVLDILLEAEKDPGRPYFVILDEMNLAKVEHYFSDFLSIMESRTPGKPQGEAIRLHHLNLAQTEDGRWEIPGEIHIPANVFFAGTVNVDESTYMFSPKVLDRANVIEFNDVELDGDPQNKGQGNSFVLRNTEMLPPFFDQSRLPFCQKQDYDELHEGKNYLWGLKSLLQEHNLHFGYRVANEFSRFVNLAKEELEEFDLDEAFDIQILQKILPKLHGTRAKLEGPLVKLIAFCDDQSVSISEEQLASARSYDKTARFPRSARKIAQMLKQLSIQGYVSFIE